MVTAGRGGRRTVGGVGDFDLGMNDRARGRVLSGQVRGSAGAAEWDHHTHSDCPDHPSGGPDPWMRRGNLWTGITTAQAIHLQHWDR